MAAGPIGPVSAFPATINETFRHIHQTGLGSRVGIETLGYLGPPAANGTWRLVFDVGATLPTGTPQLSIHTISTAATGVRILQTDWARVPAGSDPSNVTYTTIGTDLTITFTTADTWLVDKIVLTGQTVAANDMIHVDLIGLLTGSTIVVASGHLVSLEWI